MSRALSHSAAGRLSAPKSSISKRRRATRLDKPTSARSRKNSARVRRSTSAAKTLANRRNALKSTGPRSGPGKRRSSRNALKHGLRAGTQSLDSIDDMFAGKPAPMRTDPLLPGECAATFDTLKQELHEEFHPRVATEFWLVDEIAAAMWRLHRATSMECRLFEHEAQQVKRKLQKHSNGQPLPVPGCPGKTLTAADVMARMFADGAHPLMQIARYQRGLQGLVLRLISRIQVLKKRPNDSFYGDEDLMSLKHPGHSEKFKKTGWPDVPDARVPYPTAEEPAAARGSAAPQPSVGPKVAATASDAIDSHERGRQTIVPPETKQTQIEPSSAPENASSCPDGS